MGIHADPKSLAAFGPGDARRSTSKMNNQKTIKFFTPLSVEECYRRIKDSLATPFLSYFESKPIAGSITRSGMRIRKRIGYRNSFQTELNAQIKSRGNGSEICGTFVLKRCNMKLICVGMHLPV
jgi:hypothetical protein